MSFKPKPKVSVRATKGHILVELKLDRYAAVREAAAKSAVSMKEFVRQAIDYALEQMEE